MPASENIIIDSAKAIHGLVRERPASSPISSTALPSRRISSTQAKAPSVVAR